MIDLKKLWVEACAADDLVLELGRDPLPEEIEKRAEEIISSGTVPEME